ncbi:MAG: DUF5961 family protein [Caulobacteraceae bacterium]
MRDTDSPPARRFAAWCGNAESHRSDFVTEAASFEDAALLFAGRWLGDGAQCRIVVIDQETGERHCFTLDLDEAAPVACDAA